MLIHRVEEREWESLRELRLRALLDTPEAFGSTYEEESVDDEAGWRSWFTGWEPGFRQAVFVAVEDDRWIGMSMGTSFPKEPGLAHLFAMWVEPESRRRGAGFALVEAVLTWAKQDGADAVILGVTITNEEAVRFYTRCGFVGTADQPRPLREGSDLMTQRMRIQVGDVTDDDLIREQIRYYDDRATTYDDLYLRRGPFERTLEFMERWRAMTGELEAGARAAASSGDVLEIACGTGLWTRWFAPSARRYVAVDSSKRMLDENRARVEDDRIEYIETDVFEWDAARRFDLIVMGFFLSHVPPALFDDWWRKLAGWLKPGGAVWIVDDAWGPLRPLSGRPVAGGPGYAHHRQLEGRDYVISKVFWLPEDLERRLGELGWNADLHGVGEHFLHGVARLR